MNEHSVMYKRKPQIKFEMLFTINFPVSPPFLRVVYPRFQQYTGHITVGGSICTPILTEGDSSEFYKADKMTRVKPPANELILVMTLLSRFIVLWCSKRTLVPSFVEISHRNVNVTMQSVRGFK